MQTRSALLLIEESLFLILLSLTCSLIISNFHLPIAMLKHYHQPIFLLLLLFAKLDQYQAKESSLCSYNEFACGNSNQCVLRMNHCDGFNDCIGECSFDRRV